MTRDLIRIAFFGLVLAAAMIGTDMALTLWHEARMIEAPAW